MGNKDALRTIHMKLTDAIVALLDSSDLLRKAGASGDTGFAIGQALRHTSKAQELIARDMNDASA